MNSHRREMGALQSHGQVAIQTRGAMSMTARMVQSVRRRFCSNIQVKMGRGRNRQLNLVLKANPKATARAGIAHLWRSARVAQNTVTKVMWTIRVSVAAKWA